ncbi:hypothetical protein WICPIJ_002488 [Wickerhamomyces pijperi]|uniref:Uncharacterized protein n=1 Tax=Wickerhamomyces pijperi TaxID=599730 RepID=A0A9P8Q8W8_WICPI|nr:hypothetical protein WICPIJ_002488 [Wickerhamomyces pijperi]
MAAGNTKVPINSIPMTNCMEKQKVPQRSLTNTNSIKLCTVELIQRLLCDKRTLNLSGTTVLQTAFGTKICFLLGKVFNINVERKRSSPNNNKFFLCKVSTTLSEYLSTMSGLARIGTQ